MGSFWSTENKKVETTGNISNNVVLEGPIDIVNTELLTMIGVICMVKIVELMYLCFRTYQKSMKKRYLNGRPAISNHIV